MEPVSIFIEQPKSIETEAVVLGSMLIDPNACQEILQCTKEEYFYNFSHQLIFRAIKGLSKKGTYIDVITVGEELESCQDIINAGGFIYLSRLVSTTPMYIPVQAYIKILKEKWQRRELNRILVIASGEVIKEPVQDALKKLQDGIKVIEDAMGS